MRVVYYTYTAFLEPALHLARAMSRRTEIHLMVELSPGAWHSALFDLPPRTLPPGVLSGMSVIGTHFPAEVTRYFSSPAGFHIASYPNVKTIDPRTLLTGRDIAQVIAGLKPDVLHIDDPDMSMRLALSGIGLDKYTVVMNVHDPIPHSGERSWRKSVVRRLLFGSVDHFILHHSCHADHFARTNKIDPSRLTVIPLGFYNIYRCWIKEARDPEPRTMLFFGRISPYKGIEVLYEAMALAADRLGGIRLIVAGPNRGAYRPPDPPVLGNGCTIECRIGYVTNPELAALFQQAAVVVCPYVDATQSGVVLTAHAFDRPVIASAVGGLPEYVDHGQTGILVPPRDARALADAIIEILGDRSRWRMMREVIGQRRHADRTWDEAAERLLSIYQTSIIGHG